MSTYRLKVKCNKAQLEVVAKSGALLAYEMDRYLENFLNRKIESAPYKTQKAVSETAIQIEYNMPQRQVHSDEPVYTQPIQYQVLY